MKSYDVLRGYKRANMETFLTTVANRSNNYNPFLTMSCNSDKIKAQCLWFLSQSTIDDEFLEEPSIFRWTIPWVPVDFPYLNQSIEGDKSDSSASPRALLRISRLLFTTSSTSMASELSGWGVERLGRSSKIGIPSGNFKMIISDDDFQYIIKYHELYM